MYLNLKKWYKKQQIQKDNKINKITKLIWVAHVFQIQYKIIAIVMCINFQRS